MNGDGVAESKETGWLNERRWSARMEEHGVPEWKKTECLTEWKIMKANEVAK